MFHKQNKTIIFIYSIIFIQAMEWTLLNVYFMYPTYSFYYLIPQNNTFWCTVLYLSQSALPRFATAILLLKHSEIYGDYCIPVVYAGFSWRLGLLRDLAKEGGGTCPPIPKLCMHSAQCLHMQGILTGTQPSAPSICTPVNYTIQKYYYGSHHSNLW